MKVTIFDAKTTSSAPPTGGLPVKEVLCLAILILLIPAGLCAREAEPSKPSATDKSIIKQSTRHGNPLLTLNFHQSDINEILSALAIQQKTNIVTSNEVEGNVTVHLFDVTFKTAVKAVASAGGYRVQEMEDVYYVYKAGKNAAALGGQTTIRVFKLRFADIAKIGEVLGAIPDIRLVKIHEPTRTIVVEDSAENIARIETIIDHWDTPPRQVLIEAKILEVTLTDEMTLGVNWEHVLGDATFGTGGFSSAVLPTTEPVSPVPPTGVGIFGNIITGAGTRHQLAMALDALRTKTRVNTLSTPKILALHGKKARVQVGGQQGYKVTTTNLGVASETIEFIETGTILEITPFIDAADNVLLSVKPTINSAKIEEGIPVVNSTEVSTWLMARNQETVLIGGLFQEEAVELQSSIPCVGDIPGIGYLFGRKSHGTGKSELVVLITPTVLDGAVPGVVKAKEKVDNTRQEIQKQDLIITPYKLLKPKPSDSNAGPDQEDDRDLP